MQLSPASSPSPAPQPSPANGIVHYRLPVRSYPQFVAGALRRADASNPLVESWTNAASMPWAIERLDVMERVAQTGAGGAALRNAGLGLVQLAVVLEHARRAVSTSIPSGELAAYDDAARGAELAGRAALHATVSPDLPVLLDRWRSTLERAARAVDTEARELVATDPVVRANAIFGTIGLPEGTTPPEGAVRIP